MTEFTEQHAADGRDPTPAQLLPAPEGLPGHYKLCQLLGQGGTSRVYRAWQSNLRRFVAVKILTSSEPDWYLRIIREAEILGKLSHPGIFHLLDCGDLAGSYYLVTAYRPGLDLQQKTAVTPLGIADCLKVGVEVSQALAAAHGAGVVHRDIKPSNIYWCDDGTIVVLDFGIARTATSDLTRTGIMVATPQYGAPEQLTASPSDHRVDLYSLGQLLFELLTSLRPFALPSLLHILDAKQNLRIATRFPPELAIPREFKDLIAELMAPDPMDRPDSALEVSRRLEDIRLPRLRLPKETRAVTVDSRWKSFSGLGAVGALLLLAVASRMGGRTPEPVPPAATPAPARSPRVAALRQEYLGFYTRIRRRYNERIAIQLEMIEQQASRDRSMSRLAAIETEESRDVAELGRLNQSLRGLPERTGDEDTIVRALLSSCWLLGRISQKEALSSQRTVGPSILELSLPRKRPLDMDDARLLDRTLALFGNALRSQTRNPADPDLCLDVTRNLLDISRGVAGDSWSPAARTLRDGVCRTFCELLSQLATRGSGQADFVTCYSIAWRRGQSKMSTRGDVALRSEWGIVRSRLQRRSMNSIQLEAMEQALFKGAHKRTAAGAP
jgi:hypothetical protein